MSKVSPFYSSNPADPDVWHDEDTCPPGGDRFRLAIAFRVRATETGSARSALKSAGEGRDPRSRPIADCAAQAPPSGGPGFGSG